MSREFSCAAKDLRSWGYQRFYLALRPLRFWLSSSFRFSLFSKTSILRIVPLATCSGGNAAGPVRQRRRLPPLPQGFGTAWPRLKRFGLPVFSEGLRGGEASN